MRYDNGEMMAAEDHTDVDCVCGIPDSGVGMALGYAAGMNKPYQRAISKYTPTWPRSFTPANQEMRSLVARMKLIAGTRYPRAVSVYSSATTPLCVVPNCVTMSMFSLMTVHAKYTSALPVPLDLPLSLYWFHLV